jgi:hypothetical protein
MGLAVAEALLVAAIQRRCPACGGHVTEGAPSENGHASFADRIALRPPEAAKLLGVSERKLRQMLPRLRCVVREGGVVLILPDLLREDLHRLAAESLEHSAGKLQNTAAARARNDGEADAFVRDLKSKAARRRQPSRVAGESSDLDAS